MTGDNPRTAHAIAVEVGVDEVFADLTPEGKAAKVRELTEARGHVAMVGDGVNDAPAMAAATVGVAMGVSGTDVALETADVALMGDDLERVGWAVRHARRHAAIVRQNLALAFVYNYRGDDNASVRITQWCSCSSMPFCRARSIRSVGACSNKSSFARRSKASAATPSNHADCASHCPIEPSVQAIGEASISSVRRPTPQPPQKITLGLPGPPLVKL
ncbi:MAG: HAD-IC family P-type ATPase [Vicinamibacterales bacterium]